MSWKRWSGWVLVASCACTAPDDERTIPPTERPQEKPVPTHPIDRIEVGSARECEIDQLSPPEVYGHKVKSVLTGLPLDAAELAQLRSAPESLETLARGWMRTPEFERVALDFFATAFQQNEPDMDGLTTMLRRNNLAWGRFSNPNENLAELMMFSIRESFARTALRILKEGRPFNEVVTTDTFEMNTALLVLHALLESRFVTDDADLVIRDAPALDGLVLYANEEEAPPPEEALDPSNPRFLHLHVPGFDSLCAPNGARTLDADRSWFRLGDASMFVFTRMMGRPDLALNAPVNQSNGNTACRSKVEQVAPLLSREDFQDWRPVRFRRSSLAAQPPTPFYDLVGLRAAEEIVVKTERVGFFTQLGFFTTWPTNEDNASRVTLNQTLITALGKSFDGTTVTDFSPPNLDEEHSAPGSACYGCHQTLDPMRDFFRRSYSVAYGLQDNQERIEAMEPIFVFRGVEGRGDGVDDLAQLVASHPEFASAWVQKLCHFANAVSCPEASEEFAAVVQSFESSNLDFGKMMLELMISPLVTNAECVEGGTGHQKSIMRRTQLCSNLSHRLGVENVCGEGLVNNRRSNAQRNVRGAITSIPDDTFARGEPEPIIISQTGLFTRATREVTCTVVAEQLYNEAFADMERDAVIERIVTKVMGLPEGDTRRAGALQILTEHVAEGVEAGTPENRALQSALVVACMSPGLAGVGF